jgi:hypothetical protein
MVPVVSMRKLPARIVTPPVMVAKSSGAPRATSRSPKSSTHVGAVTLTGRVMLHGPLIAGQPGSAP